MGKTESDSLKKIETSFLKKHGYFDYNKYGTITWTNSWYNDKSSIGIDSEIYGPENYIRFHYNQTDNYTQEKKNFDYKIPLTTTPCYYGGKRYWFRCPFYRNGVYCGKRVGVLYKGGDYFACRHCYDLTYASKNLSGIAKMFGSITAPDVDKALEQVKTKYYKGKPTKKYARYLRMDEKFENSFILGAYLLMGKK